MAVDLKDWLDPSGSSAGNVRRTVDGILEEIRERGLDAVKKYSAQFDDWAPETFVVTPDEIEAAESKVDLELQGHIKFAQDQVRRFAEAQLETLADLEMETLDGVALGHRHIPVGTVGAYVPGGRYPLLASAFMTILVPRVAGVDRVIACAPPNQAEGGVHPAMLYAMTTSGADTIVALGGVQALAAMAFGLIDDLPPADMLVGAGNAYVAEAKRQLFGEVGIDLLAGPTEVLVLADESADPPLVASDLLGQAEHGPTSPAILVTTSEPFGRRVIAEVDRLLESDWPTADVSGQAWRDYGRVIVCADLSEAVELSDRLAPEHLELQLDPGDLDRVAVRLRNYGSLFIGPGSTVAYGDKAIGTNHVLPTRRAARYTGGLWVGKFLKTCTWQRVSGPGGQRVAEATAAICEAERMLGHAVTARMRIEAPRTTEAS